VSQWIRADRVAAQDTPKGRALGGKFDRRDPRLSEPGSTVTELLWDMDASYCIFCRCDDRLHDADGACSGCSAGLVGGSAPHCRWDAHSGEGCASRGWSEPSPTIVTTRRSVDGLIVGRQLPPGEGVNVGGHGWDDRRVNNQSGSDYDLLEQVSGPATTPRRPRPRRVPRRQREPVQRLHQIPQRRRHPRHRRRGRHPPEFPA
jgi:hypothetical protein